MGNIQHVLLPDDRLLDQPLAKHPSLVRPFQTVLDNHAAGAHAKGGNHPAFVVEVGHDDLEAVVFDPQQVLHGHLDVVEAHKRRAGRRGVAGLDRHRLEAFLTLNQKHRKAFVGLDASHKIVAECAVGDPFLGPYTPVSGHVS